MVGGILFLLVYFVVTHHSRTGKGEIDSARCAAVFGPALLRKCALLGALLPTTIGKPYISGGTMSTEIIDQLRSKMLTLLDSERAELARDLIRSLDATSENNVQDTWEIELQRRISKIDAGQAKLLNRDEFRKRMQARIGHQ